MKKTHLIILISAVIMAFSSCTASEKEKSPDIIQSIDSQEQLQNIIELSHESLIAIDLYADWCGPCRMLKPLLEKIAKINHEDIQFYKIDVDKHKSMAAAFKVRGIPHVSFLRDGIIVNTMIGVQPESAYQRIIDQFKINGKENE